MKHVMNYTKLSLLGIQASILLYYPFSICHADPLMVDQYNIEAVQQMPDLPQPLHIRNWKKLTQEYVHFVFNPEAKGKYLPLVWILPYSDNTGKPCFGICSYVGDNKQSTANAEGIAALSSVLSGELVGENLQSGKYNYVKMCEAFYNRHNGTDLVLNNLDSAGSGSFWYDIWPQILFDAISYKCPNSISMRNIMKRSSLQWAGVTSKMVNGEGKPDFNYTGFNFKTWKPVKNGKWTEPDSAAGIAWIEFAAWTRFHNPAFLTSAKTCESFLSQESINPLYENLIPWGVVTAARMNAEIHTHYPLNKMLNWCFGTSAVRPGWGMIAQKWGDYDCYGLIGSTTDHGGYAFAMNSFAQAGALLPIVRYAPQYATAIGKWMLNLTNAARLFYSNQLPASHNFGGEWSADPLDVIACEGLRVSWNGESPCATGDPLTYNWGPKTNLAVYGSSYCGMLGAVVQTTNVPGILKLDCLKTDFDHGTAFPTYLFYNPYSVTKRVKVILTGGRKLLYDAVSRKIINKSAAKQEWLEIAPHSACLLVEIPAADKHNMVNGNFVANGIVAAYR